MVTPSTFRQEVTAACIKAIQREGGMCPSCGAVVAKADRLHHAEDCLELRDDVASGL